MDRTGELLEIYERSRLKDIFISNGQRYFKDRNYSKLKFTPNDFGVSSIELYDLKNGASYFRIHYLERAPSWLAQTLRTFHGFRSTNQTGANFVGDPSLPSKALYAALSIRL